jgi:AAA15 family ATPase/GTPase
MLIEFSVTNFRSFRERQTLSMVASRLSEHAETHSFDSGLVGFDRLLATTVLYGPNASGKTNLMRALQTMQQAVINPAMPNLALKSWRMPFKLDATSQVAPTAFEITFIQNDVRYEYGFEVDGERIVSEWLIEYVNPRGRTLFERTYNLEKKDYDWQFSTFLKGQRTVWKETTRPNALFLSVAVQLNSHQLAPIFQWFSTKLSVIVAPTLLNVSLTPKLLEQPDGKAKLLSLLQEADFNISDVKVVRQQITPGTVVMPGAMVVEQGPEGTWATHVTFSHSNVDGGEPVAFDYSEESHGTQVLFQAAGAWLNVLEKGEVILFDELETSLHPLLIRYFVEQFHSTSSNPRHAQLIFSTHNTSLLDMDLFRRDQIWFVERGRKSASRLYPLTKFKPRQGEALERGYLRGRYGALPVIDGLAV